MDKQFVLATVWHTMWHSYCKKMYIDSVWNFTGKEYYVEAIKLIKSRAEDRGYQMKVGRKYISLVKGE